MAANPNQPIQQTVRVDLGSAGPALVAIAIIALIGVITVSAIFHYSTDDDALKFWAALSGIVGVVTGAFVSYFFTKSTVQQTQTTADNAQTDAQAARQDQQAAIANAIDAHNALAAALAVAPPDVSNQIRSDPAVQKVLG